jgi:hypothetical protein
MIRFTLSMLCYQGKNWTLSIIGKRTFDSTGGKIWVMCWTWGGKWFERDRGIYCSLPLSFHWTFGHVTTHSCKRIHDYNGVEPTLTTTSISTSIFAFNMYVKPCFTYGKKLCFGKPKTKEERSRVIQDCFSILFVIFLCKS